MSPSLFRGALFLGSPEEIFVRNVLCCKRARNLYTHPLETHRANETRESIFARNFVEPSLESTTTASTHPNVDRPHHVFCSIMIASPNVRGLATATFCAAI